MSAIHAGAFHNRWLIALGSVLGLVKWRASSSQYDVRLDERVL